MYVITYVSHRISWTYFSSVLCFYYRSLKIECDLRDTIGLIPRSRGVSDCSCYYPEKWIKRKEYYFGVVDFPYLFLWQCIFEGKRLYGRFVSPVSDLLITRNINVVLVLDPLIKWKKWPLYILSDLFYNSDYSYYNWWLFY